MSSNLPKKTQKNQKNKNKNKKIKKKKKITVILKDEALSFQHASASVTAACFGRRSASHIYKVNGPTFLTISTISTMWNTKNSGYTLSRMCRCVMFHVMLQALCNLIKCKKNPEISDVFKGLTLWKMLLSFFCFVLNSNSFVLGHFFVFPIHKLLWKYL